MGGESATEAHPAGLPAGMASVHRLTVVVGDPSRLAERARHLGDLPRRFDGLEDIVLCAGAGSLPPEDAEQLLAGQWRQGGLRRSVDYVLDARADPGAALDGRDGSLADVVRRTRRHRAKGVAVRWRVPLAPCLVFRLEALFSLAADEGADAVLVDPRALPQALAPAWQEPDEEERRFAADFVAHRLVPEAEGAGHDARAGRYRALVAALEASPVAAPPVGTVIAFLDGDGTPNGVPRRRPADLPDDVPAPAATGARLRGTAADVASVLLDGARAGLQWALAMGEAWRGRARRAPVRPLRTVMVVGAYGGDHVGDAAILGGVLLRLHARDGTDRAIVMSQRPGHTRRLAAMLETPVSLRVEAYEHDRVRALLPMVDAVVHGGGPLMDLPKQLVRHLYTTARAARRGLPVVMEGIGIGPFARRPSRWIARRLLRLADRVSVRTATDRASPLLRGVTAAEGRDPAFDYLETRGATAVLPARDRAWIERLLRDTAGRRVIGLNVRPIRHEFTVGAARGGRAGYTRQVEARFEEQVAGALRRLASEAGPPPCVVFFPMNAIQFGMSDLRSAYRIRRRLGGEVDFRVWEGDPCLDGIVDLLRRLDVVVTMRFHAAIFALSQGRPVVGIDYRVGASYKVAALLRDAGRGEHCARIDEMTADWLYDRLRAGG